MYKEELIHYIYKVTSNSGLYYVGRHSTKNINDNYLGSGKWVRSLTNKENLIKEILSFHETFELLKEAEENLISEVINDPLNMNFNNKSIGFSCGELNPANSPQEKIRRTENNWMKTSEGKKFISENNPSKREDVKLKRKDFANEQLKNGTHNFQKEFINKHKFDSENNPAKSESHKNNMKEQIKNGTHNFCIKVTCPHCGKFGSKSNMLRYHFENCKTQKL